MKSNQNMQNNLNYYRGFLDQENSYRQLNGNCDFQIYKEYSEPGILNNKTSEKLNFINPITNCGIDLVNVPLWENVLSEVNNDYAEEVYTNYKPKPAQSQMKNENPMVKQEIKLDETTVCKSNKEE